MTNIAVERSTIFNEKIHYFNGSFSIAMLNYQRVTTKDGFYHFCSNCLVGGLEHFLFFHILRMSSSQLTFIFVRGVGQPPTRHVCILLFEVRCLDQLQVDQLKAKNAALMKQQKSLEEEIQKHLGGKLSAKSGVS